MKKKPKERDWYIEAGFELRKSDSGYWSVMEGGQRISVNPLLLDEAIILAKELRKSRNEQAQRT